MAFEDIGVGGMLTFDPKPGIGGMQKAGREVAKLKNALTGAFSGIGSLLSPLTSQLAMLGGAVGVGALVTGAFKARSAFEDMQTELGTTFNVLAGGGMMTEGLTLAKDEMKEIEKLAVKAPGGAEDLLQIYKQIVGPMSVQGKSLQDVRDLTFGASIAAKGLGFDFKNMGFGLQKMIAGSSEAGDDLFKMFSKSMGLIKVTAGEWNQLAPEERFKILSAALGKYAEAGDAVGATWSATFSTFEDIAKIGGRSFIDSLFGKVKGGLTNFNNWFIANQGVILETLGRWGDRVGEFMDDGANFIRAFVTTFSIYIPRIEKVFNDVWESISQSFALVINEYFGGIDTAEGKAKSFGDFLGYVFGEILPTAIEYVGNAVSFVLYVFANLKYAIQVVGIRIGETFGMIYLGVKNAFNSVFNFLTEPLRNFLGFVTLALDAIAGTTFGQKALKIAGIDPAEVKKVKQSIQSFNDIVLGEAEIEHIDGYSDLPESPEAKLLRQQEGRKREKEQDKPINVDIHDNRKIEMAIKNQLDGKTLSQSQARHQLELQERAGANATPWQRRQAVTRAVAPTPKGG